MPPPAKVACFKGLKGFTLAEVLITLGVIGVVAALTLPSLISKYKEKEIITALKKNYSIINNAIMQAVNDYGEMKYWDSASYDYVNGKGEAQSITVNNIDILAKYFNIAKYCGHEAKGCFSEEYTQFNGLKERDFENLSYYNKFILADGTSIAMQGYEGETANGEIWIDINGQKRPNKIGEDTFLFSITNSRLVPYNFDSIKTGKLLNKSPNGYYFSGWVLTYENMDYLHCSDLEWGKKTRCSQ